MTTFTRHTARSTLKVIEEKEVRDMLQAMLSLLSEQFEKIVQELGISKNKVESGLRHHDNAQHALSQADFRIN